MDTKDSTKTLPTLSALDQTRKRAVSESLYVSPRSHKAQDPKKKRSSFSFSPSESPSSSPREPKQRSRKFECSPGQKGDGTPRKNRDLLAQKPKKSSSDHFKKPTKNPDTSRSDPTASLDSPKENPAKESSSDPPKKSDDKTNESPRDQPNQSDRPEEPCNLPKMPEPNQQSLEAQRKRSSSTARFWDMLTGSKKPQAAKGTKKPLRQPNHYAVTSMADLPEKANKLVAASKIDRDILQEHFKEFLFVISYITKDSFRMDPDVPFYIKSEKTPCVSSEFRSLSEKEMTPRTEKELKKIYKRIEFTAKGGFGRVFSARLQRPEGSVPVAIKRLPHHTEKEKRANMGEVAFLMRCTNHPNIVNYKECWLLPTDELWIVTEFLEGGTLDLVLTCHKFREQHICYIAKEILSGISYLHELNFAHRDLKSANIMTSISGNVKIIDFGLACDFHKGPRNQLVGSPFWIPPEMLLKIPSTTEVDIWSYGVVLLELALGRVPHDHSRLASMMFSVMGTTLAETIPLIKSSNKCEFSAGFYNFVALCLVKDPTKRATAKMLFQDPWLESFPHARDGIEKILHSVFISGTLQMHAV